MKIKKYTFDNGKYEVQAADDGSSLKAYRHGEFWQNMIGDNLTAAMLNRIDELEASNKVNAEDCNEAERILRNIIKEWSSSNDVFGAIQQAKEFLG